MKDMSSFGKFAIGSAAFVAALFFAFGAYRGVFKPKLEADPVLDAQLGAQQVSLPKGVVSLMCAPSLKEAAKQVTGTQPDNLPNGFSCTAMLAGQKLAMPWATYAGEGQTVNGASALPFLRAAWAGLAFSASRSDSGALKVLARVDDKATVSTQEAAIAIKYVLTKLGAEPMVNTDAVLGAAGESEASRAWEAQRRSNAASWSKQ
ncbi:hypothetical protein M3795_25245 [Ralstonia pickettii]|uniref:hypothetical protein n=1 Tax=Ralstonia pickettii TaxID=329 RepID=UPI00203E24F0|nr:hypothetical protein [Ralstonia pickettii]MCM3583780.1 hypothetical protein [Ralstonia pickettii]